ncbi:exo-alpha-sialidase [Planctomycetota bacterium]
MTQSAVMWLLIALAGSGQMGTAAWGASPPTFEQQVLFKSGEGGYTRYRIPSLVVFGRETVLAFCEARGDTGSDWSDVDLVSRRSLDGGRTWTAMQIVVDAGPLTAGNPCPVVDRSTGTIWLPFCRGSAPGRGNAEILLTKSTDDGKTWSKPVNVSDGVKDPGWPFAGTGPGHGIQLKTGRLLIPCWADSTPSCGEVQTSYCFYSDDHGDRWRLGQSLTRNASDECDVVELTDGRVYLNARSRQGKRQRAYAFSSDGGHSWSEVEYDPSQPEPSCDGGLVRLTDTTRFQKSRVLAASPANPKARTTMTVRLSYDECRTWPVSKVVYDGPSAYVDLAVCRDHQVLCLYEADNYAKITLARFDLAWLTDGKDSLRPKKP